MDKQSDGVWAADAAAEQGADSSAEQPPGEARGSQGGRRPSSGVAGLKALFEQRPSGPPESAPRQSHIPQGEGEEEPPPPAAAEDLATHEDAVDEQRPGELLDGVLAGPIGAESVSTAPSGAAQPAASGALADAHSAAAVAAPSEPEPAEEPQEPATESPTPIEASSTTAQGLEGLSPDADESALSQPAPSPTAVGVPEVDEIESAVGEPTVHQSSSTAAEGTEVAAPPLELNDEAQPSHDEALLADAAHGGDDGGELAGEPPQPAAAAGLVASPESAASDAVADAAAAGGGDDDAVGEPFEPLAGASDAPAQGGVEPALPGADEQLAVTAPAATATEPALPESSDNGGGDDGALEPAEERPGNLGSAAGEADAAVGTRAESDDPSDVLGAPSAEGPDESRADATEVRHQGDIGAGECAEPLTTADADADGRDAATLEQGGGDEGCDKRRQAAEDAGDRLPPAAGDGEEAVQPAPQPAAPEDGASAEAERCDDGDGFGDFAAQAAAPAADVAEPDAVGKSNNQDGGLGEPAGQPVTPGPVADARDDAGDDAPTEPNKDDDDDFGDFAEQPVVTETPSQPSTGDKPPANGDDDDDFGGFAEADVTARGGSDFAAAAAAGDAVGRAAESAPPVDDDFDDFGDFEDAHASAAPLPPAAAPPPPPGGAEGLEAFLRQLEAPSSAAKPRAEAAESPERAQTLTGLIARITDGVFEAALLNVASGDSGGRSGPLGGATRASSAVSSRVGSPAASLGASGFFASRGGDAGAAAWHASPARGRLLRQLGLLDAALAADAEIHGAAHEERNRQAARIASMMRRCSWDLQYTRSQTMSPRASDGAPSNGARVIAVQHSSKHEFRPGSLTRTVSRDHRRPPLPPPAGPSSNAPANLLDDLLEASPREAEPLGATGSGDAFGSLEALSRVPDPFEVRGAATAGATFSAEPQSQDAASSDQFFFDFAPTETNPTTLESPINILDDFLQHPGASGGGGGGAVASSSEPARSAVSTGPKDSETPRSPRSRLQDMASKLPDISFMMSPTLQYPNAKPAQQ